MDVIIAVPHSQQRDYRQVTGGFRSDWGADMFAAFTPQTPWDRRLCVPPGIFRSEGLMSRQKDLLRDIAAALSSLGERRISEWFTEDFRLHDPTLPEWPLGHRGATEMLEKTTSGGPTTKLEPLEMVEEGDRVAVRWRLSATREDERVVYAMMAMYRFEDGRIAEDWGVPIQGDWP
jgi:predicted SnoaL-like aldol condensation-catalyzing enzyme